MTNTEMAGLIEWIKERWPSSGHLRHWERVGRDFAMIPSSAVWEAARNHYNAGNRTAPTFSELRAEGARLAAEKGITDPEATGCDVRGSHSRNWAILDHPTKPGLRVAQCVECHTEIIRPANQLLTVGEAADMAREGSAGKRVDDLTDRIAP